MKNTTQSMSCSSIISKLAASCHCKGGVLHPSPSPANHPINIEQEGNCCVEAAEQLFDMGRNEEFHGRVPQAIHFYEQCLTIVISMKGESNNDAIRILLLIGMLWYDINHFDQAHAYLMRALVNAKVAYGPNSSMLANILNKVGNNFYEQKEYTHALEAYQEGLAVERKVYLPFSDNIATTLLNIARVYQHLKESYKALESYGESLSIKLRLRDSEAIATILSNTGLIYEELERYDQAAHVLEQAVGLYRRRIVDGEGGDNEVLLLSSALNTLGLVHTKQSKFGLAIFSFREALEIRRFRCKDGLNPQEIVPICHNLATVYKSTGDTDRALQFYNETLRLEEAICCDNEEIMASPKVIACLYREIGSLHVKRGELAEALRHLQYASTICINHPEAIGRECGFIILKSLGDLQIQMGHDDDSISTYLSAVRMFNNGSSGNDDLESNLLQLEPHHILGRDGVLLDLSSIISPPAAAAA